MGWKNSGLEKQDQKANVEDEEHLIVQVTNNRHEGDSDDRNEHNLYANSNANKTCIPVLKRRPDDAGARATFSPSLPNAPGTETACVTAATALQDAVTDTTAINEIIKPSKNCVMSSIIRL